LLSEEGVDQCLEAIHWLSADERTAIYEECRRTRDAKLQAILQILGDLFPKLTGMQTLLEFLLLQSQLRCQRRKIPPITQRLMVKQQIVVLPKLPLLTGTPGRFGRWQCMNMTGPEIISVDDPDPVTIQLPQFLEDLCALSTIRAFKV
jgi:hypothetical protein